MTRDTANKMRILMYFVSVLAALGFENLRYPWLSFTVLIIGALAEVRSDNND
jgi:hypothetical protein